MNEQQNQRPGTPRRRRRTRAEIIKENYLPTIIIAITVVLCAIFIITAMVKADADRKAYEREVAASIAAAEEEKRLLDLQAQTILEQAASEAVKYEYQTAIDLIDKFDGDITLYPALLEKRAEYEQMQDNLVLWNDPAQVVNLSFQVLVADSSRAYRDRNYSSAYNRNFVTIQEFPKILEQLYANGFVLVSTEDIYSTKDDGYGNTIYSPKDLYLPEGKQPLIITQTQINYYYYMVDSNNDKIPDSNGAGFATKLILDEQGNLANTYIDADGNSLVGAYDMVPLLEEFIAAHPDFSYRGARAILAVTGNEGVFGYRTHPSAADTFGLDVYNAEVEGAKQIVNALQDAGYEIACYTYSNKEFGNISMSQFRDELSKWNKEVKPILGDVDIIAYAWNSDIGSRNQPYSGQKFTELQESGFSIFLGFCGSDAEPWSYVGEDYVRMGRILVSGSNMYHNSSWFEGIFDPSSVLDSNRGNIPR